MSSNEFYLRVQKILLSNKGEALDLKQSLQDLFDKNPVTRRQSSNDGNKRRPHSYAGGDSWIVKETTGEETVSHTVPEDGVTRRPRRKQKKRPSSMYNDRSGERLHALSANANHSYEKSALAASPSLAQPDGREYYRSQKLSTVLEPQPSFEETQPLYVPYLVSPIECKTRRSPSEFVINTRMKVLVYGESGSLVLPCVRSSHHCLTTTLSCDRSCYV